MERTGTESHTAEHTLDSGTRVQPRTAERGPRWHAPQLRKVSVTAITMAGAGMVMEMMGAGS